MHASCSFVVTSWVPCLGCSLAVNQWVSAALTALQVSSGTCLGWQHSGATLHQACKQAVFLLTC